jgi:hypothetical protein
MGYDNSRKKKLSYSADKVRRHHRAQNLAAVFGTHAAGFVGKAAAEPFAPTVDIYAIYNRDYR